MYKVGFQGKNGTFSDLAVDRFFAGKDFQKANYPNFKLIIKDLEEDKIDYALIPVENTTTGIISRTYDFFFDHDIYAIGEICIAIKEQLIALPGAELTDIQEVYSHPEALSQCSHFLATHPELRSIAFQDTSASVEHIKNCNDIHKAALASANAAAYYDLPILLKDVQDNDHNMTRFLCICHIPQKVEGANKISAMFILKHEAGSLFRLLEVFAKKNINLLKLESRPMPKHSFEYLFYLDFELLPGQPCIESLLAEASKHCVAHKLLGYYKAYEM